MSAQLLSTASVNNWRVMIADNITNLSTIIGLVSNVSMNPSQLTAPGALVIDRIDSNLAVTPSKREYISFASISGPTIYAVTRGVGSTAQVHNANSYVEDVISVLHWNNMKDFLSVEHLSDGTHDPFSHVRQITVTGVSGASGIRGDVVLVPGTNFTVVASSGASGYSYLTLSSPTISTIGGLSQFTYGGSLSAASTNIAQLLITNKSTTVRSASIVLKSPVSGVSLIIDINKNFTTMFTTQATRLTVPGGGTYASTASIAVTSLVAGDILSMDVDAPGGGDPTCLLEV